MRLKEFASLICLAAVCLSLVSCDKNDGKGENISIPILETEQEENIQTQTAQVGTISRSYSLEGGYDYPFTENLVFAQNGTIKEICFDPESEVKKGDVLVRLDTDELDKEIETQQIRVDAAEKTLQNLKNSGASQREIDFAQVDLDIENNALDKLENSLSEYVITAPYDGSVMLYGTIDDYNRGTSVYMGQAFGSMTDRSQKVLCAKLFGNEGLENVTFGTKVDIIQGNSDPVKGKVTDVIFNEAGDYSNFVYIVTPDDKDVEFYDFGSVTVSFNIYEKEDVVTVPSEAVISVGDRTFVYTLIDGIRIETDVETGIVDEIHGITEITSGLSGGESIIIN